MFGKKQKIINKQNRTIKCLKEIINSLEDELADAKTRLYELELKKLVKKPRKTTKK